MNPATLVAKKKNMRNTIYEIIKQGEIARPALASALGVSTGTVTNIVGELIEAGLVREGRAEGRAESSGLGRKARLLRINSDLRYIVALNTPFSEYKHSLEMYVCDLLGGVISRKFARFDMLHSEINPENVIVENFIAAVSGFINEQPPQVREKISVVAMSVPGLLNNNDTIYMPSYNWASMPLQKPLQAALGIPLHFQNKIRVEAIYEMLYMDKADKNVLYVTVTSGIGLAHFYGGKLIEGKNGIAGEAGHMTVDINGERCYCGNYGCIEMYCRAYTILERGQTMLTGDDRDEILSAIVGRGGGQITMEHMFEAMRAGSVRVHMLFAQCARYLGVFLANITNCYDPDKIIISGPLLEYDDFVYNIALEEARGRIINRFKRDIPVVRGRLKGNEPEKAICASALDMVLDLIMNDR